MFFNAIIHDIYESILLFGIIGRIASKTLDFMPNKLKFTDKKADEMVVVLTLWFRG